jgi:hypothetical protein
MNSLRSCASLDESCCIAPALYCEWRGVLLGHIGNAIGPSMIELLRQLDGPEVLFSPIRSSPRKQDAAPESVVAWTAASGLDGEPYRLLARSLITSRFNRERPRHYALVCKSDTKLQDYAVTGQEYDVSFKAKLVSPYLIHLSGPKPISPDILCEWTNAVTELWRDGCNNLKA